LTAFSYIKIKNTKKGISLILSETAEAAGILRAVIHMDDVSAVNYAGMV
jgi:trehalose-6-phosphate synthase